MENLMTLEDCFLQEYKNGNITKANLIDNDFEDLVEQYRNGFIDFLEYSEKFYRKALNLIKERIKVPLI